MKKIPAWVKTVAKTAVTAVILYVVFRKIDIQQSLAALRSTHPLWLGAAAVWFVVSKVLSALRFNVLLRAEGVLLSETVNLRLYWLGMYYNLLLPGGISGDGYKVKLLHDATGKPVKRLIAVALLDRLSGMAALGQLALVILLLLPEARPLWWLWSAGLLLSLPITLFLFRRLGGVALQSKLYVAAVQSLGVQLAQLICAVVLLLAIGEEAHWLGYGLVFLVSSVAAMLPLTIGGAGARELVFLWGAKYLQLNAAQAVATAFLFYLLSTLVSLGGIVFSFQSNLLPKNPTAS